jgi:hypothetical protein
MRFLHGKRGSVDEGAFEYVYVNQDGSVREVSPNEQEYLEEEFSPYDGARPYTKSSYESLDGWGSMSGFIPRNMIPTGTRIDPVNPQYDSLVANDSVDYLEAHRLAGDIIETGPDGRITCSPDPNLSTEERFEIMQRVQIERQRKREELGKFPQSLLCEITEERV